VYQSRSSDPAEGTLGSCVIRTVRSGDAATIYVSGELDVAASPRLEDVIRDAEDSELQRVVIDLTRLSFVDSTGLSVLLRSRRRCNGGEWLQFIPSQQPNVARLLEITGTVEMLR
jgi:anti-sigma B factor antagonist